MNLDFAYIACLWGNSENDFAYRRIERDYEFEDEIIEAEQYFWEEYIEKKVEPAFTGKPVLALQNLKMYLAEADSSLGVKELPSAFSSELEEFVRLKEEKSKLEADVRRIEDEIKRISIPIIEEMGAFCESELPSAGKKFRVSYKPRKSVRILSKDLEKLAIHHKDIYDEYVSKTESRTLNVFPTDDSLLKMLYLAMIDITKKWTGKRKDWGQIHSQLEIFFADRLPQ